MTLQELCLSTIGKSLDRFCHAYCTTDSDDLRLRFQFLQKVYSSELVSLWMKSRVFSPPCYADLVFSKYLKSLDTGWLAGFSWKTILHIFTNIGPSLEKVVFNEYYNILDEFGDTNALARFSFGDREDCSRVQWKNIICYLPNVKSITCQGKCKNGILQSIAKYCPKLETLDIKYSYAVTGDGLKCFYSKKQRKVPCPLLKEIFVESTPLRFESVKYLLKNLPLLEKIDYVRLPIVLHSMHKGALVSRGRVKRYNLKHLNLLTVSDWSDDYDDILKVCVTFCRKLKSFYCVISRLEHLYLCSTLHDVEDLNLYCDRYHAYEINDILKKMGGKLTSLTLRNCSLSVSVLAQCCPRLKQLTFSMTFSNENIQYNENDSTPMFYNLQAFTVENADLSNPRYSKAVCHILASSPSLENLYLKKCNSFSSEIKTEILRCCEQCTLKIIDLSGCRTVEAEFKKDILLTCSTLETFTLDMWLLETEMQKDFYRTARNMPRKPKIVCADFSDVSDSSDEELWDP